jgi:large repetitive protein
VVTAVYSGDTNFNSETIAPVTVVVTTPDFTLSSSPASMTVSAGGSATNALSIASVLGFNGVISLSCGGGLPAGATCDFSPSSLTGGGQSNLTVTLQGPFTQTQANNNTIPKDRGWTSGAELCGLFGLFLVGFAKRRRRLASTLVVLIVAFGFLSGCGGGHSGPTSTLVVVGSTQSKVASGSSVTFTAQVSQGGKTPTGTVSFFDGATALGNPVTINDGGATLPVNNLAVGTHLITAKYSGDSDHSASVSSAYYEAVTGTTTLQVVAASGSVSHTLNVKLTVQ